MQVIINGLTTGAIYALFAIGFNLIFSTVRFFNLAYGATILAGAYFTWYFQTTFEMSFFPSAAIGIFLSAMLGLLTWVLIFKPLKKRKSSDLVLMVASFGLLLLMQNMISMIFKPQIKSISMTDTIQPSHDFGIFLITSNEMTTLAVAFSVLILLSFILKKTKAGLMIRAIGDNPELAKTSGIPTDKIIYLVFVIGTALGSIGVHLSALDFGIRPSYAMPFILKAVIASIIGGIGSVSGALYGALILGVAENLGILWLGSSWQDTVAFLLLTAFLLFRPQGIVATQKRLS